MPTTRANPLLNTESGRLAALDGYAILDTAPEREFDDIVQMAKRIFAIPIALVSFVAANRQFFKARIGMDVCQTDREGSFCTHAIRGYEVMVVPDATLDERFSSSPLVTSGPHIRFYAGAPLITPDGFVVGSFCILDSAPRIDFSNEHRETLEDLARLVMERLEARKLKLAQLDSRKQFESIAAVSPDAIICANGSNSILFWNKAAEVIFGYTAAEAMGQPLTIIVPPPLRALHEAGLARAVAGQPTKLVGAVVSVPACRRDGTEFSIELSLSHWIEGGEHRFGAIARDITDRRRAEERLKHEAEFDHLTDIANRKVLSERMAEAGCTGSAATLLLLDLDGFKDVNDSLGHAAGDEVLKTVAKRLVSEVGHAGLVSRLGGDEFAVFLTEIADPVAATSLCQRLIAIIEEPIEVDERSVYVGASGGIAVTHGVAWEPNELLGDTDLALYRAKAEGKSRVSLFTPDLRSVARTRTSVSSGMREAWERREFEMYYQPQVRLDTSVVTGAEALIRWNHPERGLVSPAAFLTVLESSLLAVPVSEWILRTACEQAANWRKIGLSHFRIGVNLFAAQFRSGDLPQVVEQVLGDYDLPAEALELEITENIILQSDGRIKADLAQLRDLGVGIAFDDYGTGYASLTMLKDYPVTRLKIDRSFVSGVERSRKDQTIVEAISNLARGFNLDVIAEGIETREQAELMRQHCSEGQGYLFGRPMAAKHFGETCLHHNNWRVGSGTSGSSS
ncbi:EAL domain-containing protein [Methylobacterium sp. E-041]|uniref:putative bifunctional diguanylate cyclase/phosphodiesterase n=1 Tax=unclassified Methylobacterium TaxID=2615210 RepID=UPI001FBB685B|nr:MULTISPECIES: EAL domain-containing protein [unclassified Methylobacterium]MCJ2039090.1 EAL domain-containing protein [Methylobacterium sp. J-059]MCJ2104435.1 EAL domain-containing protein [Methylobacterium sp. E-041]